MSIVGEMNKISEYFMFENGSKKKTKHLIIFDHFTADSYNAMEAKVPV